MTPKYKVFIYGDSLDLILSVILVAVLTLIGLYIKERRGKVKYKPQETKIKSQSRDFSNKTYRLDELCKLSKKE